MKHFLLCAALLCQLAAWAQSPVVLTIEANTRGAGIPRDFAGLSFETSNLLPDTNGHHLFSVENQPLINLFRNIGIRNLRVGGGTVDLPRYAVPSPDDIDHLFAFAKAAEVKVIYSFRLLNGNRTNAAVMAEYIWQHYQAQLDAFAIGNEPDWKAYHNADPRITNYTSFLADWRDFAKTIITAVPGAKFAGPDTGSNYPVPGATDTRFHDLSWSQLFADDEKNSGIIAAVLQHDYVGQNARNVSAPTAVDAMLSSGWVNLNYPVLYHQVLSRVTADGLPWRMTECNDYVGGVKDASNGFAAALWALDYMHWWAAHSCSGVNFHNRRWIFTDTIYQNAAGNFQINPKAYGLKAFTLGSQGNVLTSVGLSNPGPVNVAGYAVGDGTNLWVTIINKTHQSAGGTNVVVTLKPEHFLASAGEFIRLESTPPGDCLANTARLGDSAITGAAAWSGHWTALPISADGQCVLTVNSASAAIVHLMKPGAP